MKLIRLIKKQLSKILFRLSSHSRKVEHYRKLGIRIGKNLRLTGVPDFGSEPFLISIGDDVTITQNVVFHTHDGGVGLFRKDYPGINIFGKIKIGNNVFIGSNVIFMPGVSIGDNVVIGAGSIVTKDISSNSVAVGNPARVIKTIGEYLKSSLDKAVFVKETNPDQRSREILNLIDN